MADRCDLTELLKDQCAHCLGQSLDDTTDPAAVTVTRTMPAKYEGRCSLDARHPIEAGDTIGLTEHGAICTACAAVERS